MMSYIKKPLSTLKSNLFNKKSLSPYSHREIQYKNNNMKILKNLLTENKKGHEPGSSRYINFSQNNFIRIGDMSDNSFIITESKKTLKIKPPLTTKPILKKGDICYQTASNVGNVCFYDGENAYYNSHIRKLSFRENKFYIFSMLKSSFCKNQVDIGGSIKGVDNFAESYLLNTFIPFPTKRHNDNPKDIESIVSLITQNIIDKEEQIKFKNRSIDDEIEKELRKNQKSKILKYSYPKISTLKSEKRLDSAVYTNKYKDFENSILNYKNGNYFLNEKLISPGSTPKDYYFSDVYKNEKFKDWITPKNIENRQLSFRTFIHTKTNTKIKKYSLVLNGIRYVGNGIFIEDEEKFYTNQNMLIINQFKEKTKQLFLFCFLTSKIGKSMQIARRNFGIVPILYVDNLCKIPIEKFLEENQKERSNNYYKKVNKLEGFTLYYYLKENKKRNKKLGIFQLNIEIFELKEKLEDLIDKIIMDKFINISNYISDNKS